MKNLFLHILSFIYKRDYLNKSFYLDTRNLGQLLEEVPLNLDDILKFINTYLKE